MKARDEPAITEAFERLYRAHRGEIQRRLLRETGNREEAEDLAQKSFLNAFTALNRGTRPDQPRAWLHAISRNVRRRHYRTPRPATVELDLETPLHAYEDAPTVYELKAALARLTPNQRESFLLFELGGLNYAEIARRLDVSPAAVESLLVRARRTLRTALGRPGRGLFGIPLWLSRLLDSGPSGADLLARTVAATGAAAAGVVVMSMPSAVSSATGAHPYSTAPVPTIAADALVKPVTRNRLPNVAVDAHAPVNGATTRPTHHVRITARPALAPLATMTRRAPANVGAISPEVTASVDGPRTPHESAPLPAPSMQPVPTPAPAHSPAEAERGAVVALVAPVGKVPAVPELPAIPSNAVPPVPVPTAPTAAPQPAVPPAPDLPGPSALTQPVPDSVSPPLLP